MMITVRLFYQLPAYKIVWYKWLCLWLTYNDVTGVDEICIRRSSWCESRHEVAVRKPAKRSTGPVFNSAVADIAVRCCLSARDAQRAKHAWSSGVECPAGLGSLRSQQHRQMSAELRRRPRTVQGQSVFDSSVVCLALYASYLHASNKYIQLIWIKHNKRLCMY